MSLADKKVLVVEDDNMLRNIIIEQLRGSFLVIPAGDGEEALKQIALNKPEVIILDLLLPKVSGFEVLAKLRAMSDKVLAKTPVVVISNLVDQGSVEKANQFVIEEYYAKSDISFGVLINRVKRIVNAGPDHEVV